MVDKLHKNVPICDGGKNIILEGDKLKRTPYEEQETIINIPAAQVSKTAEVYTSIPSMLKKLRNQAKSRPDCVRIKRDLGDALFAEVDRSCVRITPKRIVSDEQRATAAKRLAEGRVKKNGSS